MKIEVLADSDAVAKTAAKVIAAEASAARSPRFDPRATYTRSRFATAEW